ncbi:MAG TPA: hypothetical protein VEX86_23965 [Longimicrobium sp.]|nr:hypothetical protein [Longimicrobium sp.]
MDDERLDLSPLDPEPARWRAVMDGTRARVDAVLATRARQQDALAVIAGWTRPLLAAAAAAVLLVAGAEAALDGREERRETVRGLVALSTGWARGAPAPSGADLLHAISRGEAP